MTTESTKTEDPARALPEKLLQWGPTFMSRVPGEVEKVEWPNEKLWELRDQRLREMLQHAKANSPWHSERLANVDPESITGEDVSALPVMTKADLMSNWDDIVTDRRLTLAGANEHIERIIKEGPQLWFDEYLVIPTGGSTGNRAVVVWHADDLLESWLAFVRYQAWGAINYPDAMPKNSRGAYIGAQSPLHISRALGWLQSAWRQKDGPPQQQGLSLSPSTPVKEMVAALNELKPHMLTGYPTIFHKLANEALAGRLDIPLLAVGFAGEAMLPEAREALRAAFGEGIMIGAMYGTSEAIPIAVGNTLVTGDYLHLQEDIGVYEPVNSGGNPVEVGVPSANLLVTNVMNKVLPFIRYEVSDEVTFAEGPGPGPFTGRRIEQVLGRADDWLEYKGGVSLHPHVVRSVLAHEPKISEYQVRQTVNGLEVLAVLSDVADLDEIRVELIEALKSVGLESPVVGVTAVDEIPRHEQTGKLKRFVTLG